MRLILSILFSILLVSLAAQTPFAFGNMSYMPGGTFNNYKYQGNNNNFDKKWTLNKYAALSAGYIFSNGISSSYISAPFGLQLNRRINNNLYAFAGVTVAPVYLNVNSAYLAPGYNNIYPMNSQLTSKGLGMYSGVQMGLTYVNDDRTFSISGSINIDRSTYPVYPTDQNIYKKQQTFTGSRQ
jgi:hypothetical protein